MTASCRDTDSVPKVPNAGRIISIDGVPLQIMHNGLRVVAGGYHGDWMADVIRSLQGHHEPQEELLFHHLLRYVRQRSTFVELGAFWAYYTAWYLSAVPYARALCVEPDENNMKIGLTNLKLNRCEAQFIQACVGGAYSERTSFKRESDGVETRVPCFDMDAVVKAAWSDCIEVLHMDVQGVELGFIQSMRDAVAGGKVRFILVSTHHEFISGSPTTHADCLEAIRSMGGHVLREHSVQESFSGDGLILASFFACDRELPLPDISRNLPVKSLFGG